MRYPRIILPACAAALILLALRPACLAQGDAGRRQTRAVETVETAESASTTTYALRLRPDQDLREALERYARAKRIRAGFIITAVGSLKAATLRLADQQSTASFARKFEIVSLVGTLSENGVHLHISLSDKEGQTIGGHLVKGCLIYTTAEIIIGEARDLIFTREHDEQTGYQELRIRRKRGTARSVK